MAAKSLTRRTILATAAASAAATLPTPFVRGAFAAGKLSIGAWDHWVPGAGKVLGDIYGWPYQAATGAARCRRAHASTT